MRAALAMVLVALAGGAFAQGVVPDPAPPIPPAEPGLDCLEPQGEAEVLQCARVAYADADGERSLAYRLAITQARVLDEELALTDRAMDVSAAEALQESQEAFLAHREAACAAEALLGVARDEGELALFACLTRITQRRVEDLSLFGTVD